MGDKNKNLQNEEVTKIPTWHEALFTLPANFLFIELNTSIQCISYRLHDLRVQILPKICFWPMQI